MAALITFLAFLIDWVVGDPQHWPHPVRFIGRFITRGERRLRQFAGEAPERLLLTGAVLALGTVTATMLAAWFLLWLAAWIWGGFRFLAALYLVYSALCLKDLCHQTWRVEKALLGGFLCEARQMLAWVVGRDTERLDEAGVRRALIETLAENLSDGLVAPLFYLALGGPVLAWGYKAVNTLDSMIGYKNRRYLHFGRFAARLDDAANYLPARLAAWLLIASARLRGHDWRSARAVWRRDGGTHSSPNSGQPEAAMAGALGIWLGGPAYYGGLLSEKPVINPGAGEADHGRVKAAERLMVGAALLMLALTLLILLIFTGLWGWL
ncbi:MAG: adenosylcobinamide-phosphate synthase CbiB [Candidatus Adiutrix sp.]|jgi:adenosylcobinamide-phosphate synthase|nr:adenosylcobinamide-phosphate synthase CbiB [Candidatus Adiutrix sp.]